MAQSSAVPLLDLKPQYLALQDEINEAVMRVIEAQGFILGPEVEAFEKEVAAYCHSPMSLGVSSGTDALLLALMASEVRAGDEVITSPYTFFATAGSIARVGARPVFVDIDPVTYNLRADQIDNLVTSKTKAIMPVHLYGQCADMEAISQIGKRRRLVVIEDAAQAIGSRDGKRFAGSIGEIGCFSFFPSKNLGAFGDAGLVTTANNGLYARMKKLRVHGGVDRYYHDEVGANFRIDALQAAVLRVKLKHLDKWTEKRRQNADLYRDLFTEAGLGSENLEGGPLALPSEAADKYHIYNQFVVRVRDRDQLQAFLTERGIGCAIYYPVPLHLQKCFQYLGYKPGAFPESERAAKETLALPIFPELTEAQLATVVRTIKEFFKKSSQS